MKRGERRLEALRVIHQWCHTKGYGPSARELGKVIGCVCSVATWHINELRNQGLVQYTMRNTRPAWRSLRMTPAGDAFVTWAATLPDSRFDAERRVEELGFDV